MFSKKTSFARAFASTFVHGGENYHYLQHRIICFASSITSLRGLQPERSFSWFSIAVVRGGRSIRETSRSAHLMTLMKAISISSPY